VIQSIHQWRMRVVASLGWQANRLAGWQAGEWTLNPILLLD